MRPQQHLAEVVAKSGTPDGTAHVLPIIAEGLQLMRKEQQAQRIEERGSDRKHNPSVSDAGKCERKVVLSLLNVPESDPPDMDAELRFLVGRMFEDAIAAILERYQGATYLREERVEITSCDVKITGRKDFDAVRIMNGESVWELKASNARALGFLLKRGTPNEDHVRQLNLYLHATGRRRGYLVVFAMGSTKGEPNLHAWIVDYDPEMAERDIAALVEADAKAKRGEVPAIPSEYKKNSWPCNYCSYRKFCHEADYSLMGQLAASIEARTS
jgi:CRISPR/Cas system-associated exonuclease Cas4 (RecB family)